MIVLPELELILVTPPKTASTSLHALLCREPWRGIYVIGPTDPSVHVNQHSTHFPPQFGLYPIAAVVRQPLARLASLWVFMTEEQRFYRRPEISFAAYVRLVVDRKGWSACASIIGCMSRHWQMTCGHSGLTPRSHTNAGPATLPGRS